MDGAPLYVCLEASSRLSSSAWATRARCVSVWVHAGHSLAVRVEIDHEPWERIHSSQERAAKKVQRVSASKRMQAQSPMLARVHMSQLLRAGAYAASACGFGFELVCAASQVFSLHNLRQRHLHSVRRIPGKDARGDADAPARPHPMRLTPCGLGRGARHDAVPRREGLLHVRPHVPAREATLPEPKLGHLNRKQMSDGRAPSRALTARLIATPTLRLSGDEFVPDRCTSPRWWRENSPGRSSTCAAAPSPPQGSASTTVWPLSRIFFGSATSAWRSCPAACDPGITSRHPVSRELSASATQTVHTASGGLSATYVLSWCQPVKAPSPGSLTKKSVDQHRRLPVPEAWEEKEKQRNHHRRGRGVKAASGTRRQRERGLLVSPAPSAASTTASTLGWWTRSHSHGRSRCALNRQSPVTRPPRARS